MQYTGNWADPGSGLLYLRARDYDPVTGQFISVDPLVAETFQPYAYAGNNPLLLTDPLGLATCKGSADVGCNIGMNLAAIGMGIGDAITYSPIALLFGETSLTGVIRNALGGKEAAEEIKQNGFYTFGSIWGGVAAGPAIGGIATGAVTLARAGASGASAAASAGGAAAGGNAARIAASGAENAANGARLQAQLLGEEIAFGHGSMHYLRGEFSSVGVSTLDDFALHIEQTIINATLNGTVRQLGAGRIAYWCNGTFVVRDTNSPGTSTAFRETFEYFMRQN